MAIGAMPITYGMKLLTPTGIIIFIGFYWSLYSSWQ
jgi:hypothetical protein